MTIIKHEPSSLIHRIAVTVMSRTEQALILFVRFNVWLLARTWEGTKRCGRIILWIGFWPLGLWRSIVHSQHKHRAS